MSLFRLKCGACGHVVNAEAGSACPKCAKALASGTESYVQIYRMGSPFGMAIGYGVYINEEPYGHLANKESIRVPLPFGKYTFRFTCGMTRNCDSLTVELTPENPVVYMKARMQPGFWTNKIVCETATADSMPVMK